MAHGIRITIHHQKRRFAPRDDEMRRVIACPRRLAEKIRRWLLALEIFHAPRAPKRFEFSFWKLHALDSRNCAGDSRAPFPPLTRDQYVNNIVAAARVRSQPRESRVVKLSHQIRRRILGGYQP